MSYISIFIAIFPLTIFILSLINEDATLNLSFLDEIRLSLNDYPINNLSYSADCNGKNELFLYTYLDSKRGCSCIGEFYKNKFGEKCDINPGRCSNDQFFK